MPSNFSKDTILIFQKPELYFFPHFKEIVFSPFGIPEKSFRYLIYKFLYILRLPCCSLFWGSWKKHIRGARQVIIFDYGYQAGMETYIKKHNPSCRVYLFFWNIITEKQKNHLLFTDKSAIYSTDKGCCRQYHFKYNHMFYTKDYFRPYSPACRNRLFFLGVDKGRAAYLAQLKPLLEQCGLDCDIRILNRSRDATCRDALFGLRTDRELSYPEYCEEVLRAGVLLDVPQKGQSALTMRVMEAIYFSKKLITSCQDIVHYDFYQADNIFLLPERPADLSLPELSAFLVRPFVPYSPEILDAYDFEHWKAQFGETEPPDCETMP